VRQSTNEASTPHDWTRRRVDLTEADRRVHPVVQAVCDVADTCILAKFVYAILSWWLWHGGYY